MPGIKLTLDMPEVAAVIHQRFREERDARSKTRLLAVKLVAEGELTSAKIAELCGVSRGRLFVWLAVLRERGLDALLARGKPGPRAGTCRGVKPAVLGQLKQKLEAGEFTTVQAARRWLKKNHRIERPYASVWNWLAKIRRSAAGAAAQSLQERPASGAEIQGGAGRKARKPRH